MEGFVLQADKVTSYGLSTFVLFWCALMVVSNVYVTTSLIIPFMDYFNVTANQSAWTSSIFSLCYGIGFLIFGPLSDRYGRKQMIVIGLCILTIVTLFISLINDFHTLVALRGIQGFVAATFAPAALSYIFDVYPKHKVVFAIGCLSFGFLTAGIFGQVFAEVIHYLFHWKIVFVGLGCIYLLSLCLVVTFLPREERKGEHITLKILFQRVRYVFSLKNLLLCYVITFTLLLTFIGMYTIIGDYLNLASEQMIYVRAIGLLGMFLSLGANGIVQRISLLQVLRVGLLMSMVGMLVIGFGKSLSLIVSMSVMYVAGISLVFPVIMTLVGTFGEKYRAISASIYTFILFIGATLGPMMSLAIVNSFGYVFTFSSLSLLLGIGCVATFFMKLP